MVKTLLHMPFCNPGARSLSLFAERFGSLEKAASPKAISFLPKWRILPIKLSLSEMGLIRQRQKLSMETGLQSSRQ
jgi:hypothetical protein